EVAGGKSPLDPGAFVDTRDWADDVDTDQGPNPLPVAPLPVDGRAEPHPSSKKTPPPKPEPRRSAKIQAQAPPRADRSEPLDSLEQMLEPERVPSARPMPPPVPGRLGLYIALALAITAALPAFLLLTRCPVEHTDLESWRPAPGVLAIVLAGGEGKRLMPLTADRAKPAVPIGGRYRLI